MTQMNLWTIQMIIQIFCYLRALFSLWKNLFSKLKIGNVFWITSIIKKSSKHKKKSYWNFPQNQRYKNETENIFLNLIFKYKNNIKNTGEVIPETIGKVKIISSIYPKSQLKMINWSFNKYWIHGNFLFKAFYWNWS